MRKYASQNEKYKIVLDNNGEQYYYLDLYTKDEDEPTEWLDDAIDSTYTDIPTSSSPEEVQAIAEKVLKGLERACKKGFEDRQLLLQAKCYAGI